MTLVHPSTFEYLPPTDKQATAMHTLREAARTYAGVIEDLVPDGADKTYILRKLREVAMWCNVSVTRDVHGAPRDNQDPST